MNKISKIFENNNTLRHKILNKKFDEKFRHLIHSNNNYNTIKYPPVIAEIKYNLNNISQQYNIIENISDEELENLTYMYMQDEEITNFLFNELLKINNNLLIFKNYPFLDRRFYKKSSIIGGVCSKINIDDIKDYIDNGTIAIDIPNKTNLMYKFKRNDDKAIEYSFMMNNLYNKGVSLQWFPSMKTMQNILNQI